MADNDAPAVLDLKELSAPEAYWRGKYEESQKTQQLLTEMVRSQLFHFSTERYTRGSIGPASTVYYGADPEMLGLAAGVTGVTLSIAGFLAIGVEVGAGSLAVGLGGLAVALLSFLRRKKTNLT